MRQFIQDIPDVVNQLLVTAANNQLIYNEVIDTIKDYLSKQPNFTTNYELYKRKKNIVTYYDEASNTNGVILIHLDTHYTPSIQPKTFNAGDLFNDICFLHNIPGDQAQVKYLLYITDSTMWNYFMNKNNGFHHIFNMSNEVNTVLEPEFFKSKPITFIKALNQYHNDTISLTSKIAESLNLSFKLRLFEITSKSNQLKDFSDALSTFNFNSEQSIGKEIYTLKENLAQMIALLGNELTSHDITIIDRGIPHTPESLPSNKMGIYMFYHKGQFLKIGKVGPNSNVRFKSNHYYPSSSNSNLAKSLLLDQNFKYKIDEQSVGEWIKTNTHRIDILLDHKFGMFVLNFIEAALHLKYKPIYEGFLNQIK